MMQIKARLRRVAFQNGSLNPQLVPFGGCPRQLVQILTKEWPLWKTSEFGLPVPGVRRRRRWRRGAPLIRGARHRDCEANAEQKCCEAACDRGFRNFHDR